VYGTMPLSPSSIVGQAERVAARLALEAAVQAANSPQVGRHMATTRRRGGGGGLRLLAAGHMDGAVGQRAPNMLCDVHHRVGSL
jgi:hypothetical protein